MIQLYENNFYKVLAPTKNFVSSNKTMTIQRKALQQKKKHKHLIYSHQDLIRVKTKNLLE